MGVVYEGRDPNLDRRVAIKTVKVENLSEEAAAEYEHRFRTEARSAARLQHPNIVSVYDSDRDADVAFLVMEYIQGDDLKHHLDRGVRYSLEQSLKIIRDLLSALDYAHKQGIVHRDVKPANLLIEPGGRVKLTDFGVARIQDSGEATRTQGSMVGTLKYMAPEQVQGQKIDSRADLFSVGVVLYQLLTDKRPFDGDNDFSIIHQIIGHTPPPPSSVNPRLPPAIDAVVARALAKERDERFATARDFAVALQAAIRRAEDQTVVPPVNPNKKVEYAASRPLTRPGTVPPGSMTTPSTGTLSSVTQELELVYWKDVKDSPDPEELQGFLEKFPAGIYADLARRRLRKMSGGEQTVLSQPGIPARGPSMGSGAGTGTGTGTFAATQFPDGEATRLRTDASRPASAMEASDLRPVQLIDEEYTRTQAEPRTATTEAAVASATIAAAAAPAASASPARPAATAAANADLPKGAPAGAPMAKPGRSPREERKPVGGGKKKLPVAVLAGIGLLAAAGVLAVVMGRSKAPDTAATTAAAPAPAASVAAPAPAPAAEPAPAPAAVAAAPASADVPAADASAAASTPAAGKAQGKADTAAVRREKERAARQARLAKVTPLPPPVEPDRALPTPAPAHVEAEPPAARPSNAQTAANNANYQAVDQCRDKMFISRELCLSEYCGKPGVRNHPLCVKHRDEVRLREESKQQAR